jgi:hypothetical protein
MNATTTVASPTSVAPGPTNTGNNGMGGMGNNNNNNGQGSSSSSPLLFFVALGFGVVFTNLWIIVGVKYCFRYNQRNRALRAHADGDPIDLTVMPRPHRRRREKKLMTMDEVNTKFPLIKYKAWRASREKDGLPTAGGISVPPSRAASVMDVDGILARKSHDSNRPGSSLSTTQRPTSTGSRAELKDAKKQTSQGAKSEGLDSTTAVPTIQEETISEKAVTEKTQEPKPATITTTDPNAHQDSTDEDDDETDPIENAISHDPELLGNPGDTCAICLDILEDDDDVRGLICGHAFHAACVDPWLTGRRACCPLCKADYYTPKPRPDGENGAATSGSRRSNNNALRLPQSPPSTWLGGRSRLLLLGVHRIDSSGAARSTTNGDNRTPEVAPTQQQTPVAHRLINIRWPFRRNQQTENTTSSPNTTQPTPGQLEAGVR